MPEQYKHMIVAPSLKVDTHTGAIAEGVLTFVITLAVLFIILKGPKSEIFKTWLLAIATVAIVMSGTAYTGPSMNPANLFGFPTRDMSGFLVTTLVWIPWNIIDSASLTCCDVL
ncbi:hypothetical protein Goarm_017240 [Gossypium armourianum]|uniref:Aquaporin n=1 Tax=Gossypium armourianum TaxID=34283 RepID=A0A7J9JGA7_9ROSI|nr:hypothetical protein [Gossypium armourianum]